MMNFSETHEWVRLEGSIATVGISHYAQKELGEIVFIELPQPGQTVKKGQEIAVLESTKAATDTYAPLSGKIIAVNEQLRLNPAIINQQPETDGWLFQIELSDPAELAHLLTPTQYQALTQ
jgi:glycine cleavage system H protein